MEEEINHFVNDRLNKFDNILSVYRIINNISKPELRVTFPYNIINKINSNKPIVDLKELTKVANKKYQVQGGNSNGVLIFLY